VKVTVSLPVESAEFVDEIAARAHRPRSQVLADMIEEKRREAFRRSLIEGYQAMGEEQRRFADEAREIAIADWVDEEESW
jgi:hypothetical protein